MFNKLICRTDEMTTDQMIIGARNKHFLSSLFYPNAKRRLNISVSFDLFIKIIEILAFYRVAGLY